MKELKEKIWRDFIETFPQYEEITPDYDTINFGEEEIYSWVENWEDEILYIQDFNNTLKEEYPPRSIEDVHQKLRDIMEDYGYEEYGDSILDEICNVFNYPDTNFKSHFTEDIDVMSDDEIEDIEKITTLEEAKKFLKALTNNN